MASVNPPAGSSGAPTGAASGDLAGAYPGPSLANPLANLVAGYNRTGVISGCSVGQHSSVPAAFHAVGATANDNSGNVSVVIPSGASVGDRLILVVSIRNNFGSQVSITTPSGWTAVRTDFNATFTTQSVTQAIYTKVAAGGDPGANVTVAWTVPTGGRLSGTIAAYSGSGAIDVTGAAVSTAAATSFNAPSVTTTDSDIVLRIFGVVDSFTTITPPATVRRNTSASSTGCGQTISDATQVTAGPSGTATATDASAGDWVGTTVALLPATPASPNMTVDVAAGTAVVNGTAVAVAAASGVTIAAADTTNPRRDLVTVDSSGTVAVVTGTPAANPAYPALPANKALLAVVAVAANTTAIVTANITDTRIILPASATSTNTSSTVTVTTPTLTSGIATQLADMTKDALVYLDITLAGTLTVAIGPTSAVANTIYSAVSVSTAQAFPAIRLPAGWFIKVTAVTATYTTTVLTC